MPAPNVPFSQLIQSLSSSSILSTMLAVLQQLGFPVTAFQSGQPANSLLQAIAAQGSSFSQTIVTTIMGGFLDYAAQVTPDPAVVGAAWTPGWLDVLSSSVYNVSNGAGGVGRIPATYAKGTVTFTNSTAQAQGPYAPGTFHIATSQGVTYSNTATFTIAANGTTPNVAFQADVSGAGGTAGAGTITVMVTTILGVTVTNPLGFVGSNAESNASLVARCRAKLGSLSPNGPKLAYDYISKTIPLPSPLVQLSSGLLTTPKRPVNRTKQVTNTQTGVVANYVANAAGAYTAPDLYTGSSNETITGVTNANPAQITVAAHGYATGDVIAVNGTGLAALDGQAFTITVTGANTFTVPIASGGTSATGTAYRQSDLDLIDKTVQTYCVPLGINATNQTAPANLIAISGTIFLKRGSTLTDLQAQTQASAAITAYFASLPLGGDNVGGFSTFFLKEPMQNAIEQAMANDALECLLTSPATDVPTNTAQDVAMISGNPTFNVIREQ